MKELTPKLQRRFLDTATALSPENLTCDGELSRSRVAVRLKILQEEWRKLEIDAGRKVTEDEVWDRHIAEQDTYSHQDPNKKG